MNTIWPRFIPNVTYLFAVALLLLSVSLEAQQSTRDLYAFDFKMDQLTVPERTRLFDSLGYAGITFAMKYEGQREKYRDYLETPEFTSGRLTIPAVYILVDFSKDPAEERKHWQASLAAVQPGTDLWIIILSPQATREKSLAVFREMATAAAEKDVNVIIYPHDNCFIESAEDALTYVEEIDAPNLFLTMHLCHELRHGNGERLTEVAINVAPHLKLASISGANVTMDHNKEARWGDAIKPLDEGDYDVKKFVSALQKIDYRGKTVLHTFGIEQTPKDHLARSMDKWNELVTATYQEQTTDLNRILDTPESAYWDARSKSWFISSLGGEKVTLEQDGYGWITRLDESGNVIGNRWVAGLDAPTGMASHKNRLYVGDRGVLVVIDIDKGEVIEKIPLSGAEFINDVATSRKGDVYVSDTFGNRIYRVTKKGKVEVLVEDEKLEYPNGLLVDGKQLVVATWGPMTNRTTFATSRKGTLMTIDLKSKAIRPVGAGAPIANFDGVTKYGDYYYATDWTGGRLLKISARGEVEEIVTGFVQFADLGLNPATGVLMIPEMSKNRFITVNLAGLK